jgi:pimeloyl-ACP methyl ester carboxylesterase/uncharacterized protein YukE
MTARIVIPADPPETPQLTVDPTAIRTLAQDLRSASAQIDDLGSFVSGSARIGDWHGSDATTYHRAIAPLGSRADAMSLALRSVHQQADDHADEMEALLEDRTDLEQRRGFAMQWIAGLWQRARTATEDEAPAIQAEADSCRAACAMLAADVTAWQRRISSSEQRMLQAFSRVATVEQVEQKYGGVPDPADGPLSRMPRGGTPEEVNAWWDGLTREEQLAIVSASPGSIGNLDGIPAGARSEANETSLTRDLAAWELLEEQGTISDDEATWLESARSARDALADTRARVDPVTGEPLVSQLYLYDPSAFDGDGRVAVSVGDLDHADNVSVNVPGLTTDMNAIGGNVGNVQDLYDATRSMHPDQTMAGLSWIGYDAPSGWDSGRVAFEGSATDGGHRLADTLDGLRASRDDRAHLTVVGHSYGSTTMGHALSDHDVDVDEAVAIGSPGLGANADDASEIDVPDGHFFVGRNSDDPVADLGDKGWVDKGTAFGAGLGNDPSEDDFGGRRFQAEDTGRGGPPEGWVDLTPGVPDTIIWEHANSIEMHTSYYEPNSESLWNMSQIVTGHTGSDDLMGAGHTYDPWYDGPRDPERDASVEQPSTSRRVP